MIRLIVGVFGMALTYHFRPPSGLVDAFGMLLNGRNFYLKEPVFLMLMAAFGLLALFGLIAVIRKGQAR